MSSSSIDNQLNNSMKKKKTSRWFKNVINIFRPKFKATSNRFNRFERKDSSTEISTESSSEENITFNSVVDVVTQYSSTSISSVGSTMIEKRYLNNPKTKDNWNQPSSSSYLRPNSSSFLRAPIYQNSPPVQNKPRPVNEAPVESNYSKQMLTDYGFNSVSLRSQPRFLKKTREKIQIDSNSPNREFYSSFRPNSESKTISDDAQDSWSLHYGEVSPKKHDDSLECIKEELYAPIKWVRMEHDNDEKQTKEEKPVKRQQNTFGILAFEQSQDYNDDDFFSSTKFEKEMDEETEKFFYQSIKLIEVLIKIMIDILDQKCSSD